MNTILIVIGALIPVVIVSFRWYLDTVRTNREKELVLHREQMVTFFMSQLLNRHNRIYRNVCTSQAPVNIILKYSTEFMNTVLGKTGCIKVIRDLYNGRSYKTRLLNANSASSMASDIAKRYLADMIESSGYGRRAELAYVVEQEKKYSEMTAQSPEHKWIIDFIGLTPDFFTKVVSMVGLRDIRTAITPRLGSSERFTKWGAGEKALNLLQVDPRVLQTFKSKRCMKLRKQALDLIEEFAFHLDVTLDDTKVKQIGARKFLADEFAIRKPSKSAASAA